MKCGICRTDFIDKNNLYRCTWVNKEKTRTVFGVACRQCASKEYEPFCRKPIPYGRVIKKIFNTLQEERDDHILMHSEVHPKGFTCL